MEWLESIGTSLPCKYHELVEILPYYQIKPTTYSQLNKLLGGGGCYLANHQPVSPPPALPHSILLLISSIPILLHSSLPLSHFTLLTSPLGRELLISYQYGANRKLMTKMAFTSPTIPSFFTCSLCTCDFFYIMFQLFFSFRQRGIPLLFSTSL